MEKLAVSVVQPVMVTGTGKPTRSVELFPLAAAAPGLEELIIWETGQPVLTAKALAKSNPTTVLLD
jgi:hypothetical protein